MKKLTQKGLVFTAMMAVCSMQAFASASPTETVMELIEGVSEISSSTTGDKMEARQLVVDAENYYAQPTAVMGSELAQQVQQLRDQRPNMTIGQAVDFIYERALSL